MQTLLLTTPIGQLYAWIASLVHGDSDLIQADLTTVDRLIGRLSIRKRGHRKLIRCHLRMVARALRLVGLEVSEVNLRRFSALEDYRALLDLIRTGLEPFLKHLQELKGDQAQEVIRAYTRGDTPLSPEVGVASVDAEQKIQQLVAMLQIVSPRRGQLLFGHARMVASALNEACLSVTVINLNYFLRLENFEWLLKFVRLDQAAQFYDYLEQIKAIESIRLVLATHDPRKTSLS